MLSIAPGGCAGGVPVPLDKRPLAAAASATAGTLDAGQIAARLVPSGRLFPWSKFGPLPQTPPRTSRHRGAPTSCCSCWAYGARWCPGDSPRTASSGLFRARGCAVGSPSRGSSPGQVGDSGRRLVGLGDGVDSSPLALGQRPDQAAWTAAAKYCRLEILPGDPRCLRWKLTSSSVRRTTSSGTPWRYQWRTSFQASGVSR